MGTVIEVGKAVHHVKVGDCVVSDIVIAAAVGACRTGHPTFAKT
ncbi:alcohol dehydrogenase catalytic domain-containing protein [Gallibacterium anatis]|uniref:Alcohol dehydrogenase catalytic domain-containing protein n=1 Tax=Gallibacterium anatis TaxID=750 RepID=A0A930UR11_9PAST|nr:alcohol dehydrogenase catalytic domain-containing protein [Gallibacterium anatis]